MECGEGRWSVGRVDGVWRVGEGRWGECRWSVGRVDGVWGG